MGFVRVGGYSQTDLNNKYQEGFSDGYDTGALFVTGNPVMIKAKDSMDPDNLLIINSDSEDFVDVTIFNNTGKTMKILLNATMSGNNIVKTLNGADIGWMIGVTLDFPSGGALHFYQDKTGGSSNQEGSIFLAVIGAYSSFTNNIIWTDSEDKTEGTATFS